MRNCGTKKEWITSRDMSVSRTGSPTGTTITGGDAGLPTTL